MLKAKLKVLCCVENKILYLSHATFVALKISPSSNRCLQIFETEYLVKMVSFSIAAREKYQRTNDVVGVSQYSQNITLQILC